jgi:4-hydroxy-3-methylbut-2-enyl diphosphate reductase
MIDRAEEIRPEWLADKRRIGVTAGASAPEVLVQEVIARLKALGAANVKELTGVVETIVFPMPRGLSGLKSETHASLQTPPGSASYPK